MHNSRVTVLNAQESNSTGNGPTSQESNNAGNAQQSNSTGNAQESNSTGNAQQQSKNTGNAQADFVNSILAVHNRERAAVGVPPLVWNDTAAAHAKAWVEYLAAGKAGGKILHCFQVPASERTDACPEKHHEGENLADGPDYFSPARLAQFWFNEKPILHYLQVVSNTSISVGCGIATYMTANFGKHDILSCRYYPQCGPECGAAAYVRAIEYFDKVLAIDPHDVHALTGKGAALDVLGNHTGAIEYCDKAKAIKSAANDTSFRYFIPGC